MPRALRPPASIGGNATTTTAEAVAKNGNREYMLIQNDSDTVMYAAFDEAAVLNQGLRLNANGGSYEMSRELGNLTQAVVNLIHGGSGNKSWCGVESSSPAPPA